MNTIVIEDIFPQLETKRLILKEINEKDSEDIFEIFSSEEVLKYYDIDHLKSLEEATDLIQGLDKRFKNKKGIRWGLYLKDIDKLIGTCGFHSLDKQSLRAEVGYELSKDFWGQGIMKEALEAIINFGFNTMSINRIQALVVAGNNNSLSLLKKIGFVEEGILLKYEYCRGKIEDFAILALLKRESKGRL